MSLAAPQAGRHCPGLAAARGCSGSCGHGGLGFWPRCRQLDVLGLGGRPGPAAPLRLLASRPGWRPGAALHGLLHLSPSLPACPCRTGKGDPVSQWGINGISLTVTSRLLPNPQKFVQARGRRPASCRLQPPLLLPCRCSQRCASGPHGGALLKPCGGVACTAPDTHPSHLPTRLPALPHALPHAGLLIYSFQPRRPAGPDQHRRGPAAWLPPRRHHPGGRAQQHHHQRQDTHRALLQLPRAQHSAAGEGRSGLWRCEDAGRLGSRAVWGVAGWRGRPRLGACAAARRCCLPGGGSSARPPLLPMWCRCCCWACCPLLSSTLSGQT